MLTNVSIRALSVAHCLAYTSMYVDMCVLAFTRHVMALITVHTLDECKLDFCHSKVEYEFCQEI